MHTTRLASLAAIGMTIAIAGCGSSKSNSSAGNSAPAATPSTPASSSAQSTTGAATGSKPVALITTKHADKLGIVLASGSKKLTVYLFEADKPGTSSCTGACAAVWPPVVGSPKGVAGAMSADLGTITRSDGIKQVTYKGHPLYTYRKDKDDGDAYGEGIKSFGAPWYALSPSGKKVDLS